MNRQFPGYLNERIARFCGGCILLALILAGASACASLPPSAPVADYYLTSEIAYLRDGPRYEARVLGQLYKGDRVEKLEANGLDWWRVRSGRSGQVGWIQANLLSLTPVPIDYYYVTPKTVPLRECPGGDCPTLQLLYRGDRVQRVEKNVQGWWRVLVAEGRGLGWVPESALSESLVLATPISPPKAPAPSKAQTPKVAGRALYVAVRTVTLRQLPLHSSAAVKTLEFNDQLQKVEESPKGWIKVRQPSSGAAGWVLARDVESSPLKTPRQPPPPKKKASKPPAKPKPAEPQAEPEVM